MCGRYARRSDKQKIAEHFAVHGPGDARLRPVMEHRAADLSADCEAEPGHWRARNRDDALGAYSVLDTFPKISTSF